MKKLPSYLKGLVESRARSAGDIERLEALRARIDQQIDAARKRLESADTLILDFNPVVDPSLIAPVHGRRPRVGKVKEVIDQVLLEAVPRALPTPEIAFEVAERIKIRFSTADEYRIWAQNCVNRALHKKWTPGLVSRQQTPGQARPATARVHGVSLLRSPFSRCQALRPGRDWRVRAPLSEEYAA